MSAITLSDIYHAFFYLTKSAKSRTLTAIGQYTCVSRDNNRELLATSGSTKLGFQVRSASGSVRPEVLKGRAVTGMGSDLHWPKPISY